MIPCENNPTKFKKKMAEYSLIKCGMLPMHANLLVSNLNIISFKNYQLLFGIHFIKKMNSFFCDV